MENKGNWLILFCLIICLSAVAQVPQGINYQAIVRDGSGNPITTGPIAIDVTITNGSGSFTETHNETPNQLGLVNFVIGSINTVAFQAFDFSVLPTSISIDAAGNNLGVQTLQSVPFSLIANKAFVADSIDGFDLSLVGTPVWQESGSNIYFQTGNVSIGANTFTSAPLTVHSAGGSKGINASSTTGGGQTDIYFDASENTVLSASQQFHIEANGGGVVTTIDDGDYVIKVPLTLESTYNRTASDTILLVASPAGAVKKLPLNASFFENPLWGSNGADINRLTGNVGIGTVSPTYALDVVGNAGFDQYLYHNDDADTRLRFEDDQFLIYTGGTANLDVTPTQTTIYANSPGKEPLNVMKQSDDPSAVEKVLAITNLNKNPTSAGFGPALTYYGTNGAGTTAEMTQVSSEYLDASSGSESTSLKFFTRKSGGALTAQMELDPNGQLHLLAYSSASTRMLTISSTGAVSSATIPAGGDITGVTAGTGLMGGGASGSVTVNAVGSNGLTAGADDITLGGTLNQNTVIAQGVYNFDFNLNSTGDFAIQSSGVDKFFVNNSGFVGIGTSTPTLPLQIAASNTGYAIRLDQGSTSGDGMLLYTNTTSSTRTIFNAASNVTGLLVKGNGYVGVGTTTPTNPLHVNNSASTSMLLNMTQNGGYASSTGYTRLEFGNGTATDHWMFSSHGQIGAETLNNANLNIWYDGYGNVITFRGDGRTGLGRTPTANKLEVNGTASKAAAGSWLANSDRRIKTEVKDIDKAIETINKIRPITYKYTEEWLKKNPDIEDKLYYNFIAQEFQEVFPESVQGSGEFLEGDKEEVLQMDSYNALIVSIKAIQEQQKQIEKLKAEIEALKKTK